MGKTKDPAFLFYPQDFLVGTMTMSDQQVGQYIKLLCLQHSKDGKLTEKDILKITGSHDDEIMEKFIQDEEGLYFNQRLLDEMIKRNLYSESRRKNKEKGLKKQDITNIDETHEEHMKNICETHDTHMENENEIVNEFKNNKSLKSFKKDVIYFEDDILNKTFYDFMNMRKTKIKNGAMTDKAIELAVAKLNKYPIDVAIEMLNESITNNWKGIFELKSDYKKSNRAVPKEPPFVQEFIDEIAKMEG